VKGPGTLFVGSLLAVTACTTAPVGVEQPFALGDRQESGTESESVVEAQVTAALNDEALPPPALVTWTPAPVVLQPPHLSTAAGRSPPSIVFGPGSEADYDRVLRDPSLVELPGDPRIDIRLIPQEQVHGDALSTLRTEPAEGGCQDRADARRHQAGAEVLLHGVGGHEDQPRLHRQQLTADGGG